MDYEGWNEALAARYFADAEPDVPVYLAVNDAALDEMCADAGIDAAADFERAVRGRVFGSNPFRGEFDRALRWHRNGGDGYPPFLPTLAATVLAADRMERLPGSDRGRYSYYRPLRRILCLEGEGMPDGYDDVIPALWRKLAWWLDEHEHGKRGRPTAATSSVNRNIGWALSQTVLTGADRSQIGQFLAAWKDSGDEHSSADSLLAGFEEWLRIARVGGKFSSTLADTQLRAILGEVLVQELKYFDGAARDISGRIRLNLALTSDDAGEPFGLAVRVPPRFRHSALTIEGSHIPLPQGSRLVALPHIDSITVVLGAPLELGSTGIRIGLQQADCYVFQIDDVLGAWVSVSGATLGIEHRVIVRTHLASKAREIMGAAGANDVREMRRARIPAGWKGYASYTPTQLTEGPSYLRSLSP